MPTCLMTYKPKDKIDTRMMTESDLSKSGQWCICQAMESHISAVGGMAM